jgi:hypothetical protein
MLAMLLTGLVAPAAYADTTYWRLATERVTVISNGGARRCTRIAAQFMSFERVLRDLAGLDEDSRLPPVVIYSLPEADARRVLLSDADKHRENVRNTTVYSKYLSGRDVNMAAVVDVGGADEPLQSVMLLYAETLLTTGATRAFPLWYQLGVSNTTNGLLVRDDGSVLLSRDGPFEPDVGNRAQLKYDLAALLTTSPAQLLHGGDLRSYTRRAREFAQYGLLTTPERRAHYRELTALMRQGTPADQAVAQAFGIPLAKVAQQLEDGAWRRQAQFRIAAQAGGAPLPAPEQLDPARAREQLQLLAERVAQQPPRR